MKQLRAPKGPYEDNFERLKAWADLPPDKRPALVGKDEELWKRWNMADDLLRELIVPGRVIERLCEKFGYSKESAERDMSFAKRWWGFVRPEEKGYLKRMLIEFGTESMVRAAKRNDFGAVARLIKEIRETAGINKPNEILPDASDLRKLLAMEPVWDPTLVGGKPMSDADREALFARLIKAKRDQGFLDNSTTVDAETLDAPLPDEE